MASKGNFFFKPWYLFFIIKLLSHLAIPYQFIRKWEWPFPWNQLWSSSHFINWHQTWEWVFLDGMRISFHYLPTYQSTLKLKWCGTSYFSNGCKTCTLATTYEKWKAKKVYWKKDWIIWTSPDINMYAMSSMQGNNLFASWYACIEFIPRSHAYA